MKIIILIEENLDEIQNIIKKELDEDELLEFKTLKFPKKVLEKNQKNLVNNINKETYYSYFNNKDNFQFNDKLNINEIEDEKKIKNNVNKNNLKENIKNHKDENNKFLSHRNFNEQDK